jgi:23S rRNA pseudouridine2604 synthase
MRLNKYISETGMCSRREADFLIEAGDVTINDRRALIGMQVKAGDVVKVNGRSVGEKKKSIYIALNKPVGVTCTTERGVRDNIVDYVAHPERIFPIGRLDKDSEGLILLTNNGDIVNEILRAENRHEKEYIVGIDQPIHPEFIQKMMAGVPILGVTTQRCKVAQIDKYHFNIILTQGMNRQIRRMCEFFGYKVQSLQRVRIMNVKLNQLKIGHWRNLNQEELQGLLPKGVVYERDQQTYAKPWEM